MVPKSRTPMMVWGDLVEHGRPIVRRTLVGNNAHECMYAWVYLTDFLLVKRISERLQGEAGDSTYQSFSEFIEALNNLADDKDVDPHHQYDQEAWLMSLVISSISKVNQGKTSVVELGQTFFTLKNKTDVISKHLYSEDNAIKWVGLDNSSFAIEVAKTLQRDPNISYLEDWRLFSSDIIEANASSTFTSRFVASYAFSSTNQFLKFLAHAHFENIVFEEPFNLHYKDLKTHNHGLPIVYFDISEVALFANEHGYSVSILGAYGDNPAGSGRCVNLRLLLSKSAKYKESLEGLSVAFSEVATKIEIDCSGSLLDHYAELIATEDWSSVDKFKRANPVWSKTPPSYGNRGMKTYFKEQLKYWYLAVRYGFLLKFHGGANVRQELMRHFGVRYLLDRDKNKGANIDS